MVQGESLTWTAGRQPGMDCWETAWHRLQGESLGLYRETAWHGLLGDSLAWIAGRKPGIIQGDSVVQ